MTRYERNRRRRAWRRAVLVLFAVVVPLAAVAASMFFMNVYNRGNAEEAAIGLSSAESETAFKYNYEIKDKLIYRIELGDFKSFEEAEGFVKSIKAKKLNGFIVKENGYKVIYGVFTNSDEAGKVQESIAARIESRISEIKLPGFSLGYNEEDNTFIQLVQAADKLIWDVAGTKSMISREAAVKSKKDLEFMIDNILKGELKLEKYLGYAEKINVPRELKTFRENFQILLEGVLAHRLGSEKDYFRIQDSLLNQIEAYRKFIDKFSV